MGVRALGLNHRFGSAFRVEHHLRFGQVEVQGAPRFSGTIHGWIVTSDETASEPGTARGLAALQEDLNRSHEQLALQSASGRPIRVLLGLSDPPR